MEKMFGERVCPKCGRTEMECDSSFIYLIEMGVKDEKGHAVSKEYCFDCGMEELKRRLCGMPFTIEAPDLTKYSEEELSGRAPAINYTAELVDWPEIKKE